MRDRKKYYRSAIFFLVFSIYGKSGEFDKNRESRRKYIKSGDSRFDREGWNV